MPKLQLTNEQMDRAAEALCKSNAQPMYPEAMAVAKADIQKTINILNALEEVLG